MILKQDIYATPHKGQATLCRKNIRAERLVEQLPNASSGHGIGIGIIKYHQLRFLSLCLHTDEPANNQVHMGRGLRACSSLLKH